MSAKQPEQAASSSSASAVVAAPSSSATDWETNPLCIYLVKNDSKGEKLLFRYPFCNFDNPIKLNATDKRSLHKDAAVDKTVRPHDLNDFTDDVIASLFAVKIELCDRKFELKVNNVRFVGHPLLLHTSGSSGGPGKKPESPSIIILNIVFALDAFTRRQIANCYYDLSKVLGVAIRHEEKRCGYLSLQMKDMLAVHDYVTP